MKFLFLSNFFPPAAVGGYEQWCQEVAQALMTRGHEVNVITSRADVNDTREMPVHRVIDLEVTGGLLNTIGRFRRRERLEALTLSSIEDLINKIRPDAALIWGMWNVPRSVPALIERLLPDRTAYYFCDYWPTLPSAFVQQLKAPARRNLAGLPKRLMAAVLLRKFRQPAALAVKYPFCVSHAVRRLLLEAGIQVSHARVIYGGTDLQPGETQTQSGAVVKLLYLGRLREDKGLQTAIEALGVLAGRAMSAQLDIYGDGNSGYVQKVQRLVEKHGLSTKVRFLGSVTRADLPALLPRYDALVFPSQWEEPFARTVLEAMASNLLVIGTTTGGTGEILKNHQTGLTFGAGDALGLADQIEFLARDSGSARKYAEAARDAVLQHFTLKRMVDQIEDALISISNSTLTPANLVNI